MAEDCDDLPDDLRQEHAATFVRRYQYSLVGRVPHGRWATRPRPVQHLESLNIESSKDIDIGMLDFGGALGVAVKLLVIGVRVRRTGVFSVYGALGIGIGFDVDIILEKELDLPIKIGSRVVSAIALLKRSEHIIHFADVLSLAWGNWAPLSGLQKPITSQSLNGMRVTFNSAKPLIGALSQIEIVGPGTQITDESFRAKAEDLSFDLGEGASTVQGRLVLWGTFHATPEVKTVLKDTR